MPTVSLRVSEEEREAWRRLAGPRRLSEWLRSIANDAAKTPEEAWSPGMRLPQIHCEVEGCKIHPKAP
jgi:hypothetical protein